MWWLWVAGPIVVICIYLLTGSADKRRAHELELWRRSWGPQQKPSKKSQKGKGEPAWASGAKRVGLLPADLARTAHASGAGNPIGVFELVPRTAFLGVYEPNVVSGSDLQAVVARLAEPGPVFTARPLPIVDGVRVANTGATFAKDPAFSAEYLVEGQDPRAIKRWLNPLVREQLLEMPDLWLSVNGKTMALVLYGPCDADKLDQLVSAADVIFAEYGAEGGLSLLGDDDDDPEPEPKVKPAAMALKDTKKSGKTKGSSKSKGA